MYQMNDFPQREQLNLELADKVAAILSSAVSLKGKASIAVSGGSTPKDFFKVLSTKKLPWQDITITLADERWVNFDSDASNTRLVHEHLLQNEAVKANFFHLKQGEEFTAETLEDLNIAASTSLLPFDVLILGMGEDGHTASLFPCSDEIDECLADSTPPLLKVQPKTAPHERISFSFAHLKQSKNVILHISGESKKAVLQTAINGDDIKEMPIRAFLQHPEVNTQVFWAE